MQDIASSEAAPRRASENNIEANTPSGHPPSFSQKMLNFGFGAAVALAFFCLLLSGVYLFRFLTATNEGIERAVQASIKSGASEAIQTLAINARMHTVRIALLSCGVFVGMAFGFLGFGLFLLGAKGEIEAEGKSEAYQVKIARMSPGVFVILCAAILIGVCATMYTPFDYRREQEKKPAAGGAVPESVQDAGPAYPPLGGASAEKPAGEKKAVAPKSKETRPPVVTGVSDR